MLELYNCLYVDCVTASKLVYEDFILLHLNFKVLRCLNSLAWCAYSHSHKFALKYVYEYQIGLLVYEVVKL